MAARAAALANGPPGAPMEKTQLKKRSSKAPWWRMPNSPTSDTANRGTMAASCGAPLKARACCAPPS